MCDHGVLMTYLHFECQLPYFRRKLRAGLKELFRCSHALWACVCNHMRCLLVDQVESWCLTVPSLCWNVVQSALFGSFFCVGMKAYLGIQLFPPAVWEVFRADGNRLWNTVADLSEAPPRPR